jgi:hypothetical protein
MEGVWPNNFNTLGILWLQKQSIKTEIFAQEIEINLPHYFDQSNNGTNILEIVHFMLSWKSSCTAVEALHVL